MKTKLLFITTTLLAIMSIAGIVSATGDSVPFPTGLKVSIAGLAAIMIILAVIYRKIVMPMRGIANGMDLIRAQDFGSRLAKVGQTEADRIVEMFNMMMHNLKTERLRIREQNHFLDLLISVSPMGIIILDTYGRITMHNPAAGDFIGVKDLNGLLIDEIDTPLANGITGIHQGHTETLRLSDSKIYRCSRLSFMDNGYSHPFILIEQLTGEVMKAERLAYEKVIRMISHEVNNSVAGITSMLSTASAIIKEYNPDDTEGIAEIAEICSKRCMSMSKFITSFADVVRIPEAICLKTDLNERLRTCNDFLESMCSPHRIKFHMQLSPEPIEVMLDSVLFEQALINIMKNSIESIDSRSDGVITISTEAAPERRLIVTDNGAGISAESQAHIFTPFYTSKAKGHGLGLIFVSDVLAKHNCSFNLRTSPKDGLTRFTISFPVRAQTKGQV